MRTVPAAWAAIACDGDANLISQCNNHLIMLGDRLEVRLDDVAADNPELGRALMAVAEGIWSGNTHHQAHVLLREATQSVSGSHKHDLSDEFSDLSSHPLTSAVTAALLAKDPPMDAIAQLTSALDGSMDVNGDEVRVTVTLPLGTYPETLGGAPWPGETARVITLTARHAKWRDRQVRRLAHVQALARIDY